jgi:hypothetical protein
MTADRTEGLIERLHRMRSAKGKPTGVTSLIGDCRGERALSAAPAMAVGGPGADLASCGDIDRYVGLE